MENGIHEDCGIVLIRLRKPLDYYRQKYGSWTYGLQKLYLMMPGRSRNSLRKN